MRLPRIAKNVLARVADRPHLLALGLLLLACLAPWLGVGSLSIRLIQLVAIFTLVVSGTNLSYGYAGELSFAQAASYAAGSYIGGYMAIHGCNDLILTLLAGAAASVVIGMVVGFPSLRLGSWSLALVSLFLVLLIPNIIAILGRWTGGYSDLVGIPQAELLGQPLGTNSLYVAALVVMGLWLAFLRNFMGSPHGTAVRILRESTVLTESLGASAVKEKLKVYALSSVPIGMAGVLFMYTDQIVSPDTFGFPLAVSIVGASIIGGSRTVYGAIFGAFIMQIGPFEFATFQEYQTLFYGALLVLAGLLMPKLFPAFVASSRKRLTSLTRLLDPSRLGAAKEPDSSLRSVEGFLSSRSQPTGTDMTTGALEVRGVTMRFGGAVALDSVSMRCAPGEITAIIGPNGSGKTTMLNLIAGFNSPTAGTMSFGGEAFAPFIPWRRARAGISRTFQTPILPDDVSVLEVVASSRYRASQLHIVTSVLRLPRYRREIRSVRRAALEVLAFMGIDSIASKRASSLPLGTRRLVEVARAVAARPRVLLLDEPASGLMDAEVVELAEVLRRVAALGVIVVVVEHNVQFVLDVAVNVYVLARGKVIADGAPEEIGRSQLVADTYFGTRTAASLVPVRRAADDRSS